MDLALAVPQIHISSSKDKSLGSGELNTNMQACKESRAEGMRLKLTTIKSLKSKIAKIGEQGLIYYMSRDDIVWLNASHTQRHHTQFCFPEWNGYAQTVVCTKRIPGLLLYELMEQGPLSQHIQNRCRARDFMLN
ncbi:765173e8-4a2f-4128-863d-a7ab96ee20ac-CDS [Sclerotinia trifoliorum]|uniref:765173e8-4a2f-4128-863d-a7ab96ee20ac-CDS n=1 Tax=Sclerotinia trifoliorum TaxID=28548 RepID=A0A8H2VMY3_9HELO|nr:765173e8-4a2f-4128-863d-a7ab96ee20ac-CDS [Sclerotinia trifoliorum]